MVNARLCETARLAFFFASPRHFDFLDCETETSNCFKCETPSYKKRDCETHITAKKRDCETREIRVKFCETQSF